MLIRFIEYHEDLLEELNNNGYKCRLIDNKVYNCIDCSEKIISLFMVNDYIWNIITNHSKDMICFNCSQKRLGRNITYYDLKDTGITKNMLLGLKIYLSSSEKEKQDMLNKVGELYVG